MELLAALKDVHKNDWDIDFYVYIKEEIEKEVPWKMTYL